MLHDVGQEAGDEDRRQGQDAQPLQVYQDLCLSAVAASTTRINAITRSAFQEELKSEAPPNGGQNSKDNDDKGKGNSKGCGKGHDQATRGCGSPDKRNEKNAAEPGGNSCPTLGGTNPDHSGGQ